MSDLAHIHSTSATGPREAGTPTPANVCSSPSNAAGTNSPNSVQEQKNFIESFVVAIAKEKNQMLLPGTVGGPVFGGADVTKFIKAYESLLSPTGTDPSKDDVISTFPYYCSETIQENIKMMKWYQERDWEKWKKELKDVFRHANSQVYMYMRTYLERLCKDQLKRGNVGLKAFILAYDNISRAMITKGTLYECMRVETLLAALPKDLKGKAIVKLELDPQEPETFKYDSLHKYILDKCITADALALLDTDTAHMRLGVSAYSIPTGVPLPQMPSVTSTSQENEPSTAITTAVTTTPSTETTATAKQEETIDTKMDNMMKAFEA
jgi:hypothetical protein